MESNDNGEEHEEEKDGEKKSKKTYSKVMQEATKSRREENDEKAGGAANMANNNDGGGGRRGCTVEVFPVEFQYVIVDDYGGKASSPSSNGMMNPSSSSSSPSLQQTSFGAAHDINSSYHSNGSLSSGNGSKSAQNNSNRDKPKDISAQPTAASQHTHAGIALASRTSSVQTVLQDLIRTAAPNRSTDCTRLWRKSDCPTGDGYELLDLDALSPSPSNNTSPKSSSSKSSTLTIEKWLGLGDQNLDEPAAVKLLIEVRSSPTSDWVRGPLEFENRLQVGEFVDAQDSAGKWYEAIVREVTEDTVKVHYFGWASRWDATLPKRRGDGISKLKVCDV